MKFKWPGWVIVTFGVFFWWSFSAIGVIATMCWYIIVSCMVGNTVKIKDK